MTQIALTDNALVDLLGSCDFPGVTIESAPHEWDDGYIQKLLATTPTILIAFLGADEPNTKLTELNLDGHWGAVVCVGRDGRGQEARRLAAGAGFDLLHRAAAALHGAVLTEPNGDRLPMVKVNRLAVEADSAVDRTSLWIATIHLEIELPLPLLPTDNCYGPLDDFLRVRGDFDLPDPAADIPISVDLPQT